MGAELPTYALTPLERLQLRDALQDRWREQVRQITLLSLARYDDPDLSRDGSATASAPLDGSSVEVALGGARERLAQLEQAMRRLDERTYGACGGCGEPIGFERLVLAPAELFCGSCGSSHKPELSADMSVA